MPSRPSWEGFLKFNLIAVPVKAYGVTVSGGGKIGFHLLHKKCNSRIRYQKVCPIHGEVTKDEIVSTYEYAKGQYVTVEPEEIENLRTENDKTIGIDTFRNRSRTTSPTPTSPRKSDGWPKPSSRPRPPRTWISTSTRTNTRRT
jgi:DNA end-binding protein Ku